MATLSNRNGSRNIQFTGVDGKRKTITLGRIDGKTAATIRTHVDRMIVARQYGQPLPIDTAAWLPTITDELYRKFAKVGLVGARPSAKEMELETAFDDYIARRTDIKQYTKENWAFAKRVSLTFFGAKRDSRQITEGQANDFRRHMLSIPLSLATVAGVIKRCRQLFRDLKSRKMIAENPFENVKTGSQVNRSRMHFVPAETIQALIDSIRDRQWKLLFALARWAGLRIPSEIDQLVWADVLWDQGKMIIRSPKTEHHEGKDYRVIPIFTEVYPFLLDCYEHAEEGEKYVLPKLRNRENVRRYAEQLIERAGIKRWPKLFQNLRSSRETELAATEPLHVVCEWIGNSAAVAQKHYLQVVEADFQRFNSGAVKCAADTPRQRATTDDTKHKNPQKTGGIVEFRRSRQGSNDIGNSKEILQKAEKALQKALQDRKDELDRLIPNLKSAVRAAQKRGGR